MLVETAFALPILMLFVLGIIEYSLAFKDSLTVSSATRAGARTASAQPRQSNYASNTAAAVATALGALPNDGPQLLWIYKAGSNGFPTGRTDLGDCSICVKYQWDSVNKQFTLVSDNWAATSQNACSGTADTIGIYVSANHKFLSSLFGTNKLITDHTVMRLEPIPNGQCA